MEIDPQSDRVTYACAGHPHPVVVDADGSVRILRDGRGPALGVTDRGYTEAQAELPSGASLLLFTDGLVERRAEPLEVGLERLGAAAAAERAEPAGVHGGPGGRPARRGGVERRRGPARRAP